MTEAVLGRPAHPIDTTRPLSLLRQQRVLVTGAAGSVGTALVPVLQEAGVLVDATDIGELDVTRLGSKNYRFAQQFSPTVVFHLAGAKHAPEGEEDPLRVARVNIDGTANVLAAFPNAKVVLASTCKACDPETAYGASKLIAERLVLNAGGAVARYYNVVETSGNVFRHWEAVPDPVPVMACFRYFITLDEAVAVTLWAAVLPSGRYTVDPGGERWMPAVADALGREYRFVPPRRGDRHAEPRKASNETLTPLDGGLVQIVGTHDPVVEEAEAA